MFKPEVRYFQYDASSAQKKKNNILKQEVTFFQHDVESGRKMGFRIK